MCIERLCVFIEINSMELCGIDEAGRGPIAGPLVVAGCILDQKVEGLCDSKKLSEKRRELLFPIIQKNSTYHIVIISAQDIDKNGLSKCKSKSR